MTNLSEIGLKESHWSQMLAHVAESASMEACGLVAGIDQESSHIYEISNELKSPIRYRMSPKEQLTAFLDMEKNEWDLLAIYHSHPQGPAYPSRVDLSEAAYPGIIQLIWSQAKGKWECKAFLFGGQEAIETSLRILTRE